MNQLPPVGSHQTDPFASQDVSAIHATERERIIALEQQVVTITGMVNQMARETKGRLEQLETCATLNAETIGHVAKLRRTVAGQDKRIEELEAFHLPCAIFRLVCA